LKHFASPAFWECYDRLPENIREHADHYFQILKTNPHHPSFHFKKYRSVRIGISYRALAIEVPVACYGSGQELILNMINLWANRIV
jgi:hypothetical protein